MLYEVITCQEDRRRDGCEKSWHGRGEIAAVFGIPAAPEGDARSRGSCGATDLSRDRPAPHPVRNNFV